VEASIRTTIGSAYLDLGLDVQAREQLEKALALNRRVFGNGPRVITSVDLLGRAYALRRDYAHAEPLLKQVADYRNKTLGPRHSETILAVSALAIAEGKLAKNILAEQLAREAIENSEARFGADDPLTLQVRANLGKIYLGQDALHIQLRRPGVFEDAEKVFLAVLNTRRRVLGSDHPDTLDSMTDLATVYHRLGRFAPAEALEREIIATRSRVWGPDHPGTLAAKANLAVDLIGQDRNEESEAVDRELLAARKRILGPEHPITLETMHNLGNDVRNRRPWEAEQIDGEVLAIRKRTLGTDHPDTMEAMWFLAGDYVDTAKLPEAERQYLELAEVRSRVLGPEHPSTRETYLGLARVLVASGRFREAAETYSAALEDAIRRSGPNDLQVSYFQMRLAYIGDFQQDFLHAEPLALAAFRSQTKGAGRNLPRTQLCAYALVIAWLGLDRREDAERLARENLAIDEKIRPGSWYVSLDLAMLGASLSGRTGAGDPEHFLLTGYDGMVQNKNVMDAVERLFINLAAGWIADREAASGRNAAEWRGKAMLPEARLIGLPR
jgi:tetratricopeptide (TPR) repeat protein